MIYVEAPKFPTVVKIRGLNLTFFVVTHRKMLYGSEKFAQFRDQI